ncbi:unnamed protein product [Acanthoscelides obtectus]|uniref:Uncharacterized protein n=1 Tax=Acanthoscelides obtectus TaxID=200917 RepID=A0A9P0KM38_ACAOB|nr:unnamed protein product [Acanthoscelides obtectus]CAK1622113.1 hypothetical protein AOBTE_LOCUS1320 [Acanthoscelides obtectus]
MVQNVTESQYVREFAVLGLKSVDGSKNKFKAQDGDEFLVDFPDIVAVLPDPVVENADGLITYRFENMIDIFEIINSRTAVESLISGKERKKLHLYGQKNGICFPIHPYCVSRQSIEALAKFQIKFYSDFGFFRLVEFSDCNGERKFKI